MKMTDLETLLGGVDIARRVCAEYIEPGPRDAEASMQRMLAALDDPDFVRALDRLNRRRVIRLVE